MTPPCTTDTQSRLFPLLAGISPLGSHTKQLAPSDARGIMLPYAALPRLQNCHRLLYLWTKR